MDQDLLASQKLQKIFEPPLPGLPASQAASHTASDVFHASRTSQQAVGFAANF
jgi:hypothetical protein